MYFQYFFTILSNFRKKTVYRTQNGIFHLNSSTDSLEFRVIAILKIGFRQEEINDY